MAKDLSRYLEAEKRLWEHLGVTPVDRRVKLVAGGELRVQELGEGPPVVFIHGGSISGASWSKLAAALSGVRAIMIDRPGCGLSDPIVGEPFRQLADVERYADGLLSQILDALELEEAVVAASSYGGYLAFRGAAAHPERVSKLIEYSWLVGAPAAAAPLPERITSLPGVDLIDRGVNALMTRVPMSRGMVKASLSQIGLGKAFKSGAFDDIALDWAHALLRHTDTLANDIASTSPVFSPVKGQADGVPLTDKLLSRLTMPVLFLWGEEDPNGGAEIAAEFAPRLPNAELVIVPGAEHAPWLDDLELCVRHTEEFIAH